MKTRPVYVYDIRGQFSEPIFVVWCGNDFRDLVESIGKSLGYTHEMMYVTCMKMHGSTSSSQSRKRSSTPKKESYADRELKRLSKENALLRSRNDELERQFQKMNEAFVSANATISSTLERANALKGKLP